MKKSLYISLLSFCLSWGYSQGFEGHIKHTFTVTLDEKLQTASDKMNDPTVQEQMKLMEEQMKDPQFQKLIESNPQLKAQMEAMMKMSQGGGNPVQNMMPKSATAFLKNGNSFVKMEGGLNVDHLYLKEKKQSYQLFNDRKAYMVVNNSADLKNPSKVLKAVKTTETAKILGYNCTKYKVQDTQKGGEMYFWTTTEIAGLDYEQLKSQYSHGHGNEIEGLNGVALKMEMQSPEMNMVMEVVEIKKEAVDANLFKIPSDYKEEKMPTMPNMKK